MKTKFRMPLLNFLRKLLSSTNPHVLSSLPGKIAAGLALIAVCSSVIFAQSSIVVEDEAIADNSWLYVGLIVVGLVLVGTVLWMRSKSKTDDAKPVRTETTIKRAGVRLQSNSDKEIKADDWLQRGVGENRNNTNGTKSNSQKPTTKTASGNPTPLNYVDPKLLHLKMQLSRNNSLQQNSLSNGAQNADKNWQLSQPGTFKPLPSAADNSSVIDALEQIREDEDDEMMRSLAIRVLSAARTQESVEGLTQVALYDEAARLRIEAIMALGSFDHETVFEPVLLACADPSREVRAAAARALSRLSFNRSDSFVRVIGRRDSERLRLAALACLESGFAARAFERLSSSDTNQSYEAFAILTLLVKAGEFEPILKTIAEHSNLEVRLSTVNVLHNLNSNKMSPYLYELSQRKDLPEKVKSALDELLFHLETSV